MRVGVQTAKADEAPSRRPPAPVGAGELQPRANSMQTAKAKEALSRRPLWSEQASFSRARMGMQTAKAHVRIGKQTAKAKAEAHVT